MAVDGAPRTRKTNHRNDVVLVGQLSGLAIPRTLRSGISVVTWRLIVRRAIVLPGGPRYDAVDCLSAAPAARRRAPLWRLGDVIACRGALHRRFWRAGTATVSRCEVEVATAHRVSRPRVPADREHLP